MKTSIEVKDGIVNANERVIFITANEDNVATLGIAKFVGVDERLNEIYLSIDGATIPFTYKDDNFNFANNLYKYSVEAYNYFRLNCHLSI